MALAPVIPASNKVPGTWVQVSLGVGPSSAGDAPRKIMLTGNMTSGGSATVETIYQILSKDEAATYFDAGSELHRMAIKAFLVYPSAEVYACAITESAGTAASGTCVFAGTATAAGSVEVECVDGEKISVAVASGDAHTVVSPAVAAAINDETDWPVTAADVTGTTTVTAKHKGPRGNSIPLRCTSLAAGITVTPPATGYLTSGATDDDPATALTAIEPVRYHYFALPYIDATNIAKYKTHISTGAEPLNGKRQVWIAGCIDTLANATTLATGLNDGRGQLLWIEKGDTIPSEMAAAMAAYRAYCESVKLAHNYDGDVLKGVVSQDDTADYPTGASLASALNNGITPLQSQADGSVKICRSITTRSQDSASNPSYNVLDSSKVIVPDGVADDIQAEFAGEKWRNRTIDVGDEDGAPVSEDGVTTTMIDDEIYGILRDHEEAGNTENVDANRLALKTEIAANPDGRFIASVPVDVVEGFHQLDVDVRQIG